MKLFLILIIDACSNRIVRGKLIFIRIMDPNHIDLYARLYGDGWAGRRVFNYLN